MPVIRLETIVNAPIERVFDLSRSIDLHKLSAKGTNEEAVAGRTNGLIELNETVTWRARHFGIYQKLSVRITAYDRPHRFTDEMIKGAFATMKHEHRFEPLNESSTKMIDVFEFQSPFGILGRLVDALVLKRYMTRFLVVRNNEIKSVAESESWRQLLPESK